MKIDNEREEALWTAENHQRGAGSSNVQSVGDRILSGLKRAFITMLKYLERRESLKVLEQEQDCLKREMTGWLEQLGGAGLGG